MIVPTKIIKPVNSLLCIGARILSIIKAGEREIDVVYGELKECYPVDVPYKKYLLALIFLRFADKMEVRGEYLRIKG